MKKIIALILSAVMLLTLVPAVMAAPAADEVGKVASGYTPEGTGIDSLDKITDPAGKYYLTKDITVSETFKTEFTGTFDGNGKKITTTVALFEKVNNATVKNFTVEGSVSLTEAGVAVGSEDFYAAVAVIANGKTTFKNILSDVDIATTSANTRIAAIAATSEADYDLVIDTCVNKGDISVVKYAAGIYGWTAKAGTGEVKNCANYGKISSTGGYIGGVVNRMCGTGGGLTITNCANYGEVVTAKQQAGGILAYHYKADITVTGCYNEGKIDSSGAAGGIVANLDDGGSAVLTATVKDCLNKGAISGVNQIGGILAYSNYLKGTIVVDGCLNEGSLTGEGVDAYCGGIVGRAGHDNASANESSITVKNCVNRGEIKAGKASAAGIMGWDFMRDSVYENCVNYGNLGFIEGAAAGHAGGIVANHARADAATTTSFVMRNCVNYGKVNSNNNQAGGMIGNSNIGFTFEGCVNHGDVTSGKKAGGLAGYVYGTNVHCPVIINCVNTGKITGAAEVSQFVAYCNTVKTEIKNSLGLGSLVGTTDATKLVLIAGSSADLTKITVSGNYFGENDTTAYYTYTATAENAASVVEFAARPANSVTVATAAQLASGEVAYNLNKAIGKTVFYQTIGTDKAPTTDSTSKVVLLVNGAYTNTAPVTPKPAPTGDSAVAIVLALIAVSCGAVLTMKKAR